jgi:hypothetical protein
MWKGILGAALGLHRYGPEEFGGTEGEIAAQAEPGMIFPGNAFRKSTK